MNITQKKAILALIKEELAKELQLPCSAVLENVGSLFCISGAPFMKILKWRYKILTVARKFPVTFSVIDLDAHRFIGSSQRAVNALKETFGGNYEIICYEPEDYTLFLWKSSIYGSNQWEESELDEVNVVRNATSLDKDDIILALL